MSSSLPPSPTIATATIATVIANVSDLRNYRFRILSVLHLLVI